MAKPEKRFKCGSCEAAVFENEIEVAGNKKKVKKVSFQKRYRTADGEWKSTYSLDVNDLPKAQLVLSKAFEYLAMESEVEENGIPAKNG